MTNLQISCPKEAKQLGRAQWIAFLLHAQRPWVQFLALLNFFKEKFDVAEIFQQRTAQREETVQSLLVDRTHLVLVSGQLVLQKEA